jgi:hypothetical protein
VILTYCKRKHLSSCSNICHNLYGHQHIIFMQPSVNCIVTMENIFQLQCLTKCVTTLSLTNWKYLLKSLQFCEHTHYVKKIATDTLQKMNPYLQLIAILRTYALGFKCSCNSVIVNIATVHSNHCNCTITINGSYGSYRSSSPAQVES